jgi:hypothetical protein
MQSELYNEVVLPNMTWSPFYNCHEHIFGSTSIIQTFTDLDKG